MDEDDLDEVTEDWDQSITTPPRSPRLSVVGQSFTSGQFHGFVRTSFQDGRDRVVDTWDTVLIDSVRSGRIRTCTGHFGPVLVDPHPVHNETGRFTMSPLTLSNYQTLIRCIFSRIRQYCIHDCSTACSSQWMVGCGYSGPYQHSLYVRHSVFVYLWHHVLNQWPRRYVWRSHRYH